MAETKSVVVSDVVPVMSKITDHKLNGSNYLDWSKIVRLYLRIIDKDDHLTNDPPEDSRQIWLREDARLFLQIRNSIDSEVKSHKDLVHFETAYVVKLHSVAKLSPSQPVFTFTHPNHSAKKSNQRYKKMLFEIPSDTGSAMVHGFAGYFDATLYKDVHLGIEPSIATPNMFSWFAIFFPLRTPVCVKAGSPLEVQFWRCCGSTKVWYEWCVTSPQTSPIHNCGGRSYWVAL